MARTFGPRPINAGEQPPRELGPAGRYPGTVLAGKVARHAARSGALWGLIFGLFIFLQTHAYTSTYKTQASRDQLARSYGSNMAMNALLGSERAVSPPTVLRTPSS